MNVGIASTPLACGDNDDARRMEAAGPVDAKNAPTRSLENATNAFSTAPTRATVTADSDNTVTYVAGQIRYLGRRPLSIWHQGRGGIAVNVFSMFSSTAMVDWTLASR